MATHDKATLASQSLCDLLLSSVEREISGTTRNKARACCSLGVTTRFGYAFHRRNGLRVYLYGEVADGPHLKELAKHGLEVSTRKTMTSPWAQISPYYFDLDSEREVAAAVPLLCYAAGRVTSKDRKTRNYLSPSEESARTMTEGARITVQVSRIERDSSARKRCIQYFGAICIVCGFDFGRTYGDIGSGFIHVHHLNPLASAKGRRTVNPETDMRPVCPNCHEMLHRRNPPFTIEELKSKIS
ncbi:MAG: HNH endonuclease [Bryobacteraceae bacterium]